MATKRKTVSVTEFKSNCMAFLENLSEEGLVPTKRGRPIAKVTPIARANNDEFIGSMKGKVEIHGDIYSTRIRPDAAKSVVEAKHLPRRERKTPQTQLVSFA